MGAEFIIGFALVLLTIALVAEPIAKLVHLPHSSLLIIFGAVVAHIVTLGFDIDTGLRAMSFHDLIFFVFLPVLIFEAAFNLPLKQLGQNIGIILFLAVAGMLLTTLISAALIYIGIGSPSGFPWIAALLAGALLAATDPVAVVAQLKTLGAPERLAVLLEGESLFNDATAIVVFMLFLAIAQMPATEFTLFGASIDFLVVFVGGALIGGAIGVLGGLLLRINAGHYSLALVTLIAAYGSFLIAEAIFHVSGVMASLVAGLILAWHVQRAFGEGATGDAKMPLVALEYFWGTLSYLANGSVFLLMGVTITIGMFTERWLAMIIAIVAVLVARAVATYGGFMFMNLLISERVSGGYQSIIVWGGLRGAVTLALALSLPTELEYWWTIQAMAFGVVLFTLMVQAPSMAMLIRRVLPLR